MVTKQLSVGTVIFIFTKWLDSRDNYLLHKVLSKLQVYPHSSNSQHGSRQLKAGQPNLLELLVSATSPHTMRPQKDAGLASGTPNSPSCAKSLSLRRERKGLAGLPCTLLEEGGPRQPTFCLK